MSLRATTRAAAAAAAAVTTVAMSSTPRHVGARAALVASGCAQHRLPAAAGAAAVGPAVLGLASSSFSSSTSAAAAAGCRSAPVAGRRRSLASDASDPLEGNAFATEREFAAAAEALLDSWQEQLEEAFDVNESLPDDADVQYSDGILQVEMGRQNGTYVLNKQAPNRQIWFSSPVSGPKRFAFDAESQRWLWTLDRSVEMSALLSSELSSFGVGEYQLSPEPLDLD